MGVQVRFVAHTHQVHGHVDFVFDFGGRSHFVVTERQGNVVTDLEVRNQCPVLEYHSHLALGHFQGCQLFGRDVFTEVVDVSAGGASQPCDDS